MAETDILSMLEDASGEWENRGPIRQAVESPYLPAVLASWKNRGEADTKGVQDGKRFAFTVTLDGRKPEEQDASLKTHLNLLRKAGTQVPESEGGPVSVMTQNGDINRKTGEVRIRFYARTKITRPGAGNGAVEASAA